MYKKLFPKRSDTNTSKYKYRRKRCRSRLAYVAVSGIGVMAVSMLTPIFSSVGLMVLQHLPIPPANTHTNAHNNNNASTASTPDQHASMLQPTAYIVLGGGLTRQNAQISTAKEAQLDNTADANAERSPIVINQYTRSRLQTVWHRYQQHPLPIILSGVESPWMQEWLAAKGINDVVSENASMNTCENARFTAKRLAIQYAFLVTDAYHMRRAQRQFALNGITTTPIIATLPYSKHWWNWRENSRHSRRTIYELAAYLRDVIRPQSDCRESHAVSMDELTSSHKSQDIRLF